MSISATSSSSSSAISEASLAAMFIKYSFILVAFARLSVLPAMSRMVDSFLRKGQNCFIIHHFCLESP